MTARAIAYELRYRRVGLGADWVTARFPATDQVLSLAGLVRGAAYEGDARSIGDNNTFSAWVPVTFTVDDNPRDGNSALPPGGPANVAAAWISGGAITYTATAGAAGTPDLPGAALISVAAGTLRITGTDIAYGASSVTVGGVNGSTVLYHLYFKDYRLLGGTQTLYATVNYSDLVDSNANVYVGAISVTYPATGGAAGGGSGSPPCPVRGAWVRRRDAAGGIDQCIRAGDVVAGDYLLLSSGRYGRVSYSQPALAPCVRVQCAVPMASLTCSVYAPLGLAGGGQVLAPDSRGACIDVLYPAPQRTDRVEGVENAGERWVQHITCEDDFFMVGDNPDYLLSHHNLKNGTP